MRRSIFATVLAATLLVTGCGIRPAEVSDAAQAPTGMADGPSLYFYDREGDLRPEVRDTGRLGTVSEALGLLLTGAGQADAYSTALPDVAVTRVVVVPEDGAIRLVLPLAFDEVTPRGIDQLVCTAIGVHVQSGGTPDTTVRLDFTQAPPGADADRSCPVIDQRADPS
ncbi:hypothetical protein [Microbacterium sp. 179-I 3D3 NHS]|uniref:hypothetical protein n=1 Tax=Microbacterium sp. 179-I 3D3 NHS TaxID=3142382 RepID=UPI00399FA25B